jgi:hypothetical protein
MVVFTVCVKHKPPENGLFFVTVYESTPDFHVKNYLDLTLDNAVNIDVQINSHFNPASFLSITACTRTSLITRTPFSNAV